MVILTFEEERCRELVFLPSLGGGARLDEYWFAALFDIVLLSGQEGV